MISLSSSAHLNGVVTQNYARLRSECVEIAKCVSFPLSLARARKMSRLGITEARLLSRTINGRTRHNLW